MPTAYYKDKENGEWKRLASLNVLGGSAGAVETTGESSDEQTDVDTKEES